MGESGLKKKKMKSITGLSGQKRDEKIAIIT